MRIEQRLWIGAFVALLAGCGADPDGSAHVHPLSITIDAPSSSYAGLAVALEAQVDDPSAIVSWDFDVAAGTSEDAVGDAVEAVWRVPGTYTVRATARTAAGVSSSAETTVEIGSDFVPPVVRVPDVVHAQTGDLVRIDGAGSTDNVGIERWAWDADLAAAPAVNAAGPLLEHRYTRPGTYFASLTVWDAAGLHASGNVRVEVTGAIDAGDAPQAVLDLAPRAVRGADLAPPRHDASGVYAWPEVLAVRDEPVRVAPGESAEVVVEARYADGARSTIDVVAVTVDGPEASVDGVRVTGTTTGLSSGRATVQLGRTAVEVPFDVEVGATALAVSDGAWRTVPGGDTGAPVERVLGTSVVPGTVFALVEHAGARYLDAFDPLGRPLVRHAVPADTATLLATSPTVVWTFGRDGVGRFDGAEWSHVAPLEPAGDPVAVVFGDVEAHVFVDTADGVQQATWRLDDERWRTAESPSPVDRCDRVLDAQRVGRSVALACASRAGGRVHLFEASSRLNPVGAWDAPGPVRAMVLDAHRGEAVVVVDGADARVHRIGLSDGAVHGASSGAPASISARADGTLLASMPDGIWSLGGRADEHLTGWTASTIVALPLARWPMVLEPSNAWIGATTPLEPGVTDGVYGAPHGAGTRGQNADPTDLATLPNGASLVVELDGIELVDGPGADLVVFENPFEVGRGLHRWMEPGTLVLRSGQSRQPVPTVVDDTVPADVSGDPARYRAGVFGVVPVRANPDRGDHVPGHAGAGGDPFDLADVALPSADAFELVDIEGDGFSPDVDAVALVHWRRVVRPMDAHAAEATSRP